ncbi:homoserine dehydrogenase [Adhaeribacter sp. BT258]|uniref:Homoserine dehydrogenase n=1 Tax=Adhaeribacter terrigena TaxID=2793070 RepID=A0ABS1BZW0_9BACT|nr:homoserine dehydrogenase [Adhaeribacter terrigena]MBK0402629.1 homoserine dehydrogenase [Adhaeribacter terrigena]
MSRKNLTIGLFGFGCVGYGLYEVLHKTPGLQTTIKKICVKNPEKQRPISAGNFTFDKNAILSDPEINVVVELIDDADAAFEIVSEAMKKGKAIVSANKKMIAEHFQELLELQQEFGVPLLYEAACCASIPIIRNLEEYYDTDLLQSFEGIVNGSTNYILSKTFAEGLSYRSALEQAQENGYVETDPTLDIQGTDAKYKLLLLLVHAFGQIVKPEQIFNFGIDRISDLDLKFAKENGYKIKMVAQAFKNEDQTVSCFVLPKFVKPGDKLFGVDDVFNGLITQNNFSDTQFFVGKGAGAFPTASAVLSDLSALTYDYKYEYKKLNQNKRLPLNNEFKMEVFISSKEASTTIISTFFERVLGAYRGEEESYIRGVIKFQQLQKLLHHRPCVSIILFEVVPELESFSKQHRNAQPYFLPVS